MGRVVPFVKYVCEVIPSDHLKMLVKMSPLYIFICLKGSIE